MTENKEEIISNLETLRLMASDTAALEEKRKKASQESALIEEELRRLIAENARVPVNQEEYSRRYNKVYDRYEQSCTLVNALTEQIKAKETLSDRIRVFIDELMGYDGEQTMFEDDLWAGIVECMTVYSKDRIVFTFVGGIEITV